MGTLVTGFGSSSWISKVEKVLQRNQENPPKSHGFHILKMPRYCRQFSENFTPTEWIFGLHNRGELNIGTSESVKLSVASALGLEGQRWKDFCEDVVSDGCLLDMKQCYGLREDETNLTDEVIRYILALDALFLVAYLEQQLPRDERFVWTPTNMKGDASISPMQEIPIWGIVRNDICIFENQVPFSLINNVVLCVTEGRVSSPGNYEGYMRKLIQVGAREGVRQFMDVFGDPFRTPKSLDSLSSTWKTHFLAIAYELICGDEGLKRRSDYEFGGSYLHIPSASKLRSSGITIKGKAGSLELLSYKDGCLCLPQLQMSLQGFGMAQNIAWYENTQAAIACFTTF